MYPRSFYFLVSSFYFQYSNWIASELRLIGESAAFRLWASVLCRFYSATGAPARTGNLTSTVLDYCLGCYSYLVHIGEIRLWGGVASVGG